MTGRTLVTGASGFLGRHVVAALRRRAVVTVALTRRASGPVPTDEQICVGDETDPAALRAALSEARPDCIFHLAGRPAAESLTDLYRANALYGAALIEAAGTFAHVPVVLAGSAAEYGPHAAGPELLDESANCRPTSPYGIAKLAQTHHALAAAGRPLVVARLFNPVGAGMPDYLALGSFARQIAAMGPEGGTLFTGALDVERDFIDASAVAEALIGLAESPPTTPEVVNVCSGIGTSLRTLLAGLVAASGKRVTVEERHDRGSITTAGVSRFVGSPARLASRGITVSPPDPDRLGRDLLKGQL